MQLLVKSYLVTPGLQLQTLHNFGHAQIYHLSSKVSLVCKIAKCHHSNSYHLSYPVTCSVNLHIIIAIQEGAFANIHYPLKLHVSQEAITPRSVEMNIQLLSTLK